MRHFITGIKVTALIYLCATLLPSCSDTRTKAAQMDAALKIDTLEKKVSELLVELDKKDRELVEKRNIDRELSNLIVQAYNYEKYPELYMYAGTYLKLFPESQNYNAFYNYFNLAQENFASTKPAPDVAYQDYSSQMGVWKLGHFVDTNGNPTSSAYLTTQEILTGTYSDKNNTNALLEVYPIISSNTSIAFMLYENGSSTEVKGTTRSPVNYDITVIDGDGDSHTLKGKNNSDRVVLDANNSKTLHSLLQNGGFIQIVLRTTREGHTVAYRFTIQDATFYNNAYRQLYATF